MGPGCIRSSTRVPPPSVAVSGVTSITCSSKGGKSRPPSGSDPASSPPSEPSILMATVTSTCGIVTVPLVRGTARTIDLAVGERIEAPIFQVGAERRMDGPSWLGVSSAEPESLGMWGRTSCGMHSSPRPSFDAGIRSPTSRKPPRTPARAPRCGMKLSGIASDGRAEYVFPGVGCLSSGPGLSTVLVFGVAA
jgi:hypothetical protein